MSDFQVWRAVSAQRADVLLVVHACVCGALLCVQMKHWTRLKNVFSTPNITCRRSRLRLRTSINKMQLVAWALSHGFRLLMQRHWCKRKAIHCLSLALKQTHIEDACLHTGPFTRATPCTSEFLFRQFNSVSELDWLPISSCLCCS